MHLTARNAGWQAVLIMEFLAELLIGILGTIRMSRAELVAVIVIGWVIVLALWLGGIVPGWS